MDYSFLKQLGLTSNDIAVYTCLGKRGVAKTGALIEDTSISSSRVYASLYRLIDFGLIAYHVKNNIRYYRIESPERLLKEMDERRRNAEKFVDEFKKQKYPTAQRNEVNVYEGLHSFKKAFEQHVGRCKDREEILVISYSPRLYQLSVLRRFFQQIDQDVKQKKLAVRMILDKNLKKTIGKDRKIARKYAIRYMPPGYFSPAATNISDREVLLSVWEKNPVAFTISNRLVITTFKQNFEFLWNIATTHVD